MARSEQLTTCPIKARLQPSAARNLTRALGPTGPGLLRSTLASALARLVRSGGFYRPDALLEGLAPHLADPTACIEDLHMYTFNAVDTFEAWRRSMLKRLQS